MPCFSSFKTGSQQQSVCSRDNWTVSEFHSLFSIVFAFLKEFLALAPTDLPFFFLLKLPKRYSLPLYSLSNPYLLINDLALFLLSNPQMLLNDLSLYSLSNPQLLLNDLSLYSLSTPQLLLNDWSLFSLFDLCIFYNDLSLYSLSN